MGRQTAFASSPWAKALPPYFGGKRNLAPTILHHLTEAKYSPREHIRLVDAFTGGVGTALFFKLAGYEVHTNDLGFRSYIAAKTFIEHTRRFTEYDLQRLLRHPEPEDGLTLRKYFPQCYTLEHARMIDRIVSFAHAQADEALRCVTLTIAWKYLISLRPMTQFNSPNAFNLPLHEGRYDKIKHTYWSNLKRALQTPEALLRDMIKSTNAGITASPRRNTANLGDAIDFVASQPPSVCYMDPPYPNTLGYGKNYHPIEEMLQQKDLPMEESDFSGKDAWAFIDTLLAACSHHPIVCVSLGSAGGKNKMSELTDLIVKNRPDDQFKFINLAYAHSRQSAEDTEAGKNEEWICLAWRK